MWAHCITAPKKHIDKIYIAEVDGSIPDDIDDVFQGGIVLADGLQCLPARARKIEEQTVGGDGSGREIPSGKAHVRRRRPQRPRAVPPYYRRLRLDETLRPGEFRPLKEEEREFPFMNK